MIQLQDNALSQNDHEGIYKLLNNRGFTRSEKDTPEQPDNERTLVYNFTDTERDYLINVIVPVLKLPTNLTVTRVYANAFNFGDTPRLHTDSRDKESLTILYYPNLVWKPMWGGETLFESPSYGSESGLYEAIAPVPNRLIAFPGHVSHTARPPLYQHLVRYSIAIKMEPIKTKEVDPSSFSQKEIIIPE